jgi:hypothetical protein
MSSEEEEDPDLGSDPDGSEDMEEPMLGEDEAVTQPSASEALKAACESHSQKNTHPDFPYLYCSEPV